MLEVARNPSSSCWNDRFKVRNMHAELICLNPDDILLVSSDSFAKKNEIVLSVVELSIL